MVILHSKLYLSYAFDTNKAMKPFFFFYVSVQLIVITIRYTIAYSFSQPASEPD